MCFATSTKHSFHLDTSDGNPLPFISLRCIPSSPFFPSLPLSSPLFPSSLCPTKSLTVSSPPPPIAPLNLHFVIILYLYLFPSKNRLVLIGGLDFIVSILPSFGIKSQSTILKFLAKTAIRPHSARIYLLNSFHV